MIKTFECPECGTGMKVEIAGIEGGILRWRREQPKPPQVTVHIDGVVVTSRQVQAMTDAISNLRSRIEDRPAWRAGIFVDGRQVYPPKRWLELETKAAKDVGCKWDCEECGCGPVNHP